MRADVTRPHWSYSSVSQYLKCPLQYYFERIAKLPRKGTTDAQVLGSAVHSALATYHRQLQSGEATTSGSIRQAYLDAWDNLIGNNEVVALGGKPLDNSRDLGMTLVEVYLEQPPSGTIIAVESPMMAPIANSRGDYLEKPVMIVADLVSRQEDGTLQITEIKTSGRAYSESEVATSLQPTFYANALYEMTGKEPGVEFTVLVKTKVPKLQKIQAIRTISDYQRLGDLVGVVEKAVEAGAFYPVESPINCSGCPFYRPCRQWSGQGTSGELIHDKAEEVIPC
jgi:putative RecB family exonuclease